MSFARDLVAFLRGRCGDGTTAISLSTASWPLAAALKQPHNAIARELHDALREAFGGATLMLPAFARGFGPDGICDLDATPAATGLINEAFRHLPGFARTRSAFFSFVVSGPGQTALTSLRPEYAWGEGSVYDWMHEHDADLVTIGLHPTHTSFLHISEWRANVPYRMNKTFQGKLRYQGEIEDLTETLFVRRRDPEPVNDLTRALPALEAQGLVTAQIGGVLVSHTRASPAVAGLDALLRADPWSILKNRECFDHARSG